MSELDPDPLARGLAHYAQDLRAGRITAAQATRAYLDRIAALDGKLGAYERLCPDEALAMAGAVDALLAAGADLGPLMGVPIAVKDIFVIDGLPPPAAGSRIDVSDLAGPVQGRYIQALRRAGCVILGQTKAVEFCLGITGVSSPRGTPWNPADPDHHRLPGGSSSGSGVAMAAGLCGLAIGSDTGGSIRVPAAFNGVFGLKTTYGLWPTDGVVALDPRLDSIGLLTRSAADAAIAHREINRQLTGDTAALPARPRLDRLRLGCPANYFFTDLDPVVAQAHAQAQERLRQAGAVIETVTLPEAPEREDYFPVALPVSLMALLGRERYEAHKHQMDPVIAWRLQSGLQVPAMDYLALEARRLRSQCAARRRFDGFDAWICPTTATPAPLLSDLDDPELARRLALGMTRNTQPANYLGLCAVSLPLPRKPGALPLGLQLMAPPGRDAALLALASAIEALLADAA